MTEGTRISKYLWTSMVLYTTYLLIGSFIVSRNFFDLAYLVVLYSIIIYTKIKSKKE